MAWAPSQHTFDSLLLSADSRRARRRIRAAEYFAVPAGPLHPRAWAQIASTEDWHPERFAWPLDIVPNVDTNSCDPYSTLYIHHTESSSYCAPVRVQRRCLLVGLRPWHVTRDIILSQEKLVDDSITMLAML